MSAEPLVDAIVLVLNTISSREGLGKLRTAVADRIRDLKEQEEKEECRMRLARDGYYVTQKQLEVPGAECFVLRYYIMMSSMARDNIEDHMEYNGAADLQDPWTDELGFEYRRINDNCEWTDDDDWEYGDWDDPAHRRGYDEVYLYFVPPKTIPQSTFQLVTDSGQVLNCRIVGENVLDLGEGDEVRITQDGRMLACKTVDGKSLAVGKAHPICTVESLMNGDRGPVLSSNEDLFGEESPTNSSDEALTDEKSTDSAEEKLPDVPKFTLDDVYLPSKEDKRIADLQILLKSAKARICAEIEKLKGQKRENQVSDALKEIVRVGNKKVEFLLDQAAFERVSQVNKELTDRFETWTDDVYVKYRVETCERTGLRIENYQGKWEIIDKDLSNWEDSQFSLEYYNSPYKVGDIISGEDVEAEGTTEDFEEMFGLGTAYAWGVLVKLKE